MLKKLLGLDTDFHYLFFKNEYKTLVGKSYIRVYTLFFILLLTFLALGFAIGSIQYLDVRMNNPFTNWVDMPILQEYEKKVGPVLEYFDHAENRDSFHLKNINEYVKFVQYFYHIENEERYFRPGITIDPQGDLIKKILNPQEQNVLAGLELEEDDEEGLSEDLYCGLIVTKKMLERLGYNRPLQQQKIVIADDSLKIYANIIAVVEELPNLSDFACTPRMYNLLNEPYEKTGFLEQEGRKHDVKILSEIADAQVIKDIFKQQLSQYGLVSIKTNTYSINTQIEHYVHTLYFNPLYSDKELNKIITQLKKSGSTQGHIERYIDWQCGSRLNTIRHPYYLAFNFTELSKIRSFTNFMQQDFDINISMGQVATKENFSLVSNLTLSLCLILFFFGTTSIIFYVDSILHTHLEKVKTNLGTFKAFGLSNESLIHTYMKIIFSFLGLAIFAAWTVALGIGIIEEWFTQESRFNLLNKWVLAAISALIIVSFWMSHHTITKLLHHSPGDLIYNR